MMTNTAIRRSTARYAWLLALLAMALIVPAWAATTPAATPEDTYGAIVPVPDTSTAERGKAFVEALQQVLARVAGHPVSNTPGASEAASFVEQYRYRQAPSGAAQPFELDVHFAPDSVRHLLRTLVAGPGQPSATTTVAGAAVPGAAAASTSLWISGIHSGTDFAGALHALASTLGVDEVAISAAHGDGMLAHVDAALPPGQLLETLQAGGHFTVAAPHAGAGESLAWQP